MKKLMLTLGAAVALVCSSANAAPTVESYAAPKLVSEINTALATLFSYVYTNTASGITQGNLPLAQATNVLQTTGAGTALAAFNLAACTNLPSSALTYSTPYTTQTVAGVFTNVYDAKGVNVSHNP